MIDSQKTLWFNGDRTRFFLVPNDQELPSGDFILRRGASHQMQVDELALPPLYLQRWATRPTLGEKTPLGSLGACIFKKRMATQFHPGA